MLTEYVPVSGHGVATPVSPCGTQGVVAVFGFCELRVAVDFHPADTVLVVVAEALRHSPVRVLAQGQAAS